MPSRRRSMSASSEEEEVPTCPYLRFTSSVADMRQWFGRYDIAKLVDEGGGIAQISGFLPDDVAEAASAAVHSVPESSWRREKSGDQPAQSLSLDPSAEEPVITNEHRFSACDQETASAVEGLSRAFWVARPECMPSFSAVRFGRGDHVGCRDDRAHLEAMDADGESIVFSREIGVIYYLSKDWQPQFGGQFVDIQSQRWPIAPCVTPQFNTLLAFRIPRKYVLSAVRHSAPLYAMHGWWLVEGELYTMDDEEQDDAMQHSAEKALVDSKGAGNEAATNGPAAGTRSARAARAAVVAASGAMELANATSPRPVSDRLWRPYKPAVMAARQAVPTAAALAKKKPRTASHGTRRPGGVDTPRLPAWTECRGASLDTEQCNTFQRDGLLVADHVLPIEWAKGVEVEIRALEASGRMAATRQQAHGVRQDKVCWLTDATAPGPHTQMALAYLNGVAGTLGDYSIALSLHDSPVACPVASLYACRLLESYQILLLALRLAAVSLNHKLGLQLRAPEAAMATCYDGDGSHFIVHRDNTCDATAAASWASGSAADGCNDSPAVI